MSTYNPEIKIYYGPIDNDHRLIPAPDLSIGLTYNYSGDTIIGYSYNITLTGYATALDLRTLADGSEIPSSPDYNIGAVTDHINKLRKILTQNGNILQIVKASDNTVLLKAKGGILRSFAINESPNNWVHYAQYTATIEFHSVDFGTSTDNCDSLFLDPSTFPTADGSIVNINKYKIKEFKDSWSFTFDENDSYNKIKNNDMGINLNIDNTSFQIQYNISATGKHFFNYTNEATGASTILPAWEQAKNFVQNRLYKQVTSLIGNVLKNSYTGACVSTDTLTTINTPGQTGYGSSNNGLMAGVNSTFNTYNETISCESSESDGTFSATYTAIVKTNRGNSAWSSPNTKHTVSKTLNKTFTNSNTVTNLSVNGTIEGLISGGLVGSGPISLPSQGSILISNNSNASRYSNALVVLNNICNNTTGGACQKRDLKTAFKSALGITLAELGIDSPPTDDPLPDPPHPISFNLTHDYNNGTINYTLEYSSSTACGFKYQEISIQTSQPTKVFATFNIPNSFNCPTIQELGTYTAKNISVTIRGIDCSSTGQPAPINLANELNLANPGCYGEGYLPIAMPQINPKSILTQKQYTKNPLDGSYTVSLNYICGTSGCSI